MQHIICPRSLGTLYTATQFIKRARLLGHKVFWGNIRTSCCFCSNARKFKAKIFTCFSNPWMFSEVTVLWYNRKWRDKCEVSVNLSGWLIEWVCVQVVLQYGDGKEDGGMGGGGGWPAPLRLWQQRSHRKAWINWIKLFFFSFIFCKPGLNLVWFLYILYFNSSSLHLGEIRLSL